MTGLIEDLVALGVIAYMMLILVAAVLVVPAAVVAIVGRAAGVW